MFSWKSSHCHLEKLGKSVDRNALKENPQVVTHKNGLARSPVDGVDAVIRSLIVQGKAANLHGPKKIRNCMRNWEKTCRKRNEKCVLSGERARIRALHGRFLPDPTSAGGDGDVKLRAESSTSWFWPRAGVGMAAWGPKSLKRKVRASSRQIHGGHVGFWQCWNNAQPACALAEQGHVIPIIA